MSATIRATAIRTLIAAPTRTVETISFRAAITVWAADNIPEKGVYFFMREV